MCSQLRGLPSAYSGVSGPEDVNAVSRLRNGQGAWTWEKTFKVFQLITTEPPEQKKNINKIPTLVCL